MPLNRRKQEISYFVVYTSYHTSVLFHLASFVDSGCLQTNQTGSVIAGELVPEKDNEGSRCIYFYIQYFRNSRKGKAADDKTFLSCFFFPFFL